MGEGIAVLWPGATTKRLRGPALGPHRQRSATTTRTCCAPASPRSRRSARSTRSWRRLTVGTQDRERAHLRGSSPTSGRSATSIPQPGGRFLNERDLLEKRRVIFLGDQLAKDLFGTEDVGGPTLQINQSTFPVIGVMQAKVQMGMYSGPDKNQATHPRHDLQGDVHRRPRPSNLVYKPVRLELADQAKAEIYRVLAGKYRFDPEDTRARGDLGHPREPAHHRQHLPGDPALPRDHRRPHPPRGRHGRREHHVRGGEGADARDRREDGARGQDAPGHGALRARGAPDDGDRGASLGTARGARL